MRLMKKQMWFGVAALAMAMIATPASHAQTLNSGPTAVNLTANMAESLTLSVSPTAAAFTLVPNGVSNNVAISVTTNWVLASTHTNLTVYAYFGGTTAMSDAGGDIIPTSSFKGSVNLGAYSAFTGGAGPFGVNSKIIYQHGAFAAGQFNGSHSDTLGIEVDSTGLALPASASYTGTLNIQAQAI